MVCGIMSDGFYDMSKVTIKPVVNCTVLQIFLISSLIYIFLKIDMRHQDPSSRATYSATAIYLGAALPAADGQYATPFRPSMVYMV